MFLGSAPVESSVTKEAIAEMLRELEALRQWRAAGDADELNHAKENLVRGFAQRFETVSQVAGEIAELEGFGLESEELRATPTKWSRSDSRSSRGGRPPSTSTTAQSILVVVGDKAEIAEGLLSLEFGPLVRLDADGRGALAAACPAGTLDK